MYPGLEDMDDAPEVPSFVRPKGYSTMTRVHAFNPGNPCGKMRKPGNPYEVWRSHDGQWEWHVLKKYQSPEREAKNLHARWFCLVKSPFCPDGDMGDVYVKDIKQYAMKVNPSRPGNREVGLVSHRLSGHPEVRAALTRFIETHPNEGIDVEWTSLTRGYILVQIPHWLQDEWHEAMDEVASRHLLAGGL